MKRQLIIIEDHFDLAQYYEELLHLDNSINVRKIIFDTEIGRFSLNLPSSSDTKRAFLVDINLNDNNKEDKEGLKIINHIKERLPESLVIAYSANVVKKEALAAGANYYFLKEPGYEKRDFKIIKHIIIEYFDSLVQKIKNSSRQMEKQDKKPGAITRYQNEMITKHTQQKLKSLEKEYEAILNVRNIKQQRLTRLMEANAEANPDNVNAILSHEKDMENLLAEINNCDKKLDEKHQLMVEFSTSLDKLL